MSTAVAKATNTAKSFMPTLKEAMDSGKDLGALAVGMVGAHAIVTMTKKDTAIVNGGIALAGLGVAMKAKSPLIKMIALGASAYGTIKLLNNVTKEVAAANTVEGLNGILPESAKALIRKFIPTLSGVEELAGDDEFSGYDDLSLDDYELRGEEDLMGLSGEEDYSGTDEMAGLGEAVSLLA